MNKLVVSIGIAAFNEEKNIKRLLDSIRSQKLKKVKIGEILIISSGSTDKTNNIISTYQKRLKKIRLITQSRRLGKASAVNLILNESRNIIIRNAKD